MSPLSILFFMGFIIMAFVMLKLYLPYQGGWIDLEEHYKLVEKLKYKKLKNLKIKNCDIGGLSSNNIFKFYESESGLLIKRSRLFRVNKYDLLIPWNQFKNIKTRKTLFGKTIRLIIGNPFVSYIDLSERDYKKIENKIKASRQRSSETEFSKQRKNLDIKFKINGLVLPKAIIDRINNNNWKTPAEKKSLLQLMKKYDPKIESEKQLERMINNFKLYPISTMESETKGIKNWEHEGAMFLGKKDSNISPGFVDPQKLILFADFGLGYDTPLGLDYRKSNENPSVVMLYWGKDPYNDNRWRKIAETFNEFEKVVWID